MKMDNNYDDFYKIVNTRVTFLLKIRLYIRKIKDNVYLLPLRDWEDITVFMEKWIIKAFLIWKIVNSNWKQFFNLIYIHSFSPWYWSKLLFTFINKYNVKNILYIPVSSLTFWRKVWLFCKENKIIIKQPWEKINFI